MPGALQHAQEQIAALAAVKLWTTLITTAGYEVQIVPAIPALQTSRHAPKVLGSDLSVCGGTGTCDPRGTHSFETRE